MARTNVPFVQWSPEALGAGFILPFTLTNSSRLPSALEPMFRMLNRRDCPLDRSLVSHEKAADEISATGGPRRLSPVDVSHLGSPGSMSGAGRNKNQDHR